MGLGFRGLTQLLIGVPGLQSQKLADGRREPALPGRLVP
jgi:hypothetical protein